MSQHDMTVDNGAGVAVRADINLALKALASQSSGASAPSPTFPAQVWADTGTGRLKQRNAANSAWIDKGAIDGAMAPTDSPVFTTLVQVPNATLANQAAAFGQIPGVVGQARNVRMSVTAASATATLTADEVIVESALGGLRYCLSSLSKSINLATTGAGGMDTGTAPVSGAVGVYLIYNPTLALSSTNPALLAVNATSVRAPEVYGGANMPSGYTASALVGVYPTNASSQFPILFMEDRHVSGLTTQVLSTSTTQASLAAISMTLVPLNAVAVDLTWTANSAGTSAMDFTLACTATGIALIDPNQRHGSALITRVGGAVTLPVVVPKTTYYTFVQGGTTTLVLNNTGYRF